jgi:hypothetical protein
VGRRTSLVSPRYRTERPRQDAGLDPATPDQTLPAAILSASFVSEKELFFFFFLNLCKATLLCLSLVYMVIGAVYGCVRLCGRMCNARPKAEPTEQRKMTIKP